MELSLLTQQYIDYMSIGMSGQEWQSSLELNWIQLVIISIAH